MTARTPSKPHRPSYRRLVLDALFAAVFSLLAVVSMVAVAGFGLWLLGAAKIGGLPRITAAVVSLAAGGSVDVSGGLDSLTGGGQAVGLGLLAGRAGGLEGRIHVIPLGVTLVGAVVLAVAVLLPARRKLSARVLAVRAATTAVVFPALLTLVSAAATGRLTLDRSVLGTRPTGTGALPNGMGALPNGMGALPTGTGAMPAGGLGLRYHTDVGSTVAGSIGFVIVVVGLCWLASRRTPKPALLRREVQPAAAAVVVVVTGLAMAVTLVGLTLAVTRSRESARGGAQVAGATLLVAPNTVCVGLPAGAGVRLEADTGLPQGNLPRPMGMFGGLGGLPEQQLGAARGLSGLAGGPSWHPSGLPRPGTTGWLWSKAAALLALIVCGVTLAMRTRGDRGGRRRLAARNAGRLGVAAAAAMALLAVLAGASVRLGVAILGFRIGLVHVAVEGSIASAVALGLVTGALGGAAGVGIVAAAGGVRRRPIWHGTFRRTPTRT